MPNFAVQADLARLRLQHTEQRQSQLGASGAKQAGNAQYLSPPERKIHIIKCVGQGQSFHLQQRLLAQILRHEFLVLNFPTGHIERKLFFIQLADGALKHIFAVAQNGNVFADFKHFIQFVAHKQN